MIINHTIVEEIAKETGIPSWRVLHALTPAVTFAEKTLQEACRACATEDPSSARGFFLGLQWKDISRQEIDVSPDLEHLKALIPHLSPDPVVLNALLMQAHKMARYVLMKSTTVDEIVSILNEYEELIGEECVDSALCKLHFLMQS